MFCRVSCVILLLCTLNTRSSVSYSAAPYKNHYRSSLATHQGSYLLNRNRPQNSRTFYDRRQNTVRPLYGGGTPVLVSYNLCPYEGLSAIPCTVSKQYYYACYKDCMVYAKCDPHQIFDLVTQSCQRNNQTTNYTELPPCQQDGFFASPYNCKDYYNCKYNKHQNVFIQLKLRCAEGQCFNSHTGKCECQSTTTTPAPCTTHPCDAETTNEYTTENTTPIETTTYTTPGFIQSTESTQTTDIFTTSENIPETTTDISTTTNTYTTPESTTVELTTTTRSTPADTTTSTESYVTHYTSDDSLTTRSLTTRSTVKPLDITLDKEKNIVLIRERNCKNIDNNNCHESIVPKVSMTVLGEMDVEISTCDDGNCKPAAPNTQVVEVNGQPLIYMNQLK